ncbi:MAG: Ig-like domain-containing protein, partial [Candidatus Eremiobacteraeota bacterium]|nr:Ig-like domain-containing protein [Candidatus Eremiobacteraeota bacterium]
IALAGCGGGGGGGGGAAGGQETFDGYIYYPGGKVARDFRNDDSGMRIPGLIFSTSSSAPDGYQPASDVTVYLLDYPGNTTTTDSNGHFSIPFDQLPIGEQELYVDPSGNSRDARRFLPLGLPVGIPGRGTGTLVKIDVIPNNVTVVNGSFHQFFAIGKDESGRILAVNVTWHVVPDDLGTINSNGFFQAEKAGSGSILAVSSDGIVGMADIEVEEELQTAVLTGYVRNQDNNPLQGVIVRINRVPWAGVTDSNGYYAIPELPPGIPLVTWLVYENTLVHTQILPPLDAGYNSQDFIANITEPPLIQKITPGKALPGDRITIRGNNFGTTRGTITIGGTTATIDTWRNKKISCFVPDSLSPGHAQVQVTAGGEPSNIVYLEILEEDVIMVLPDSPTLYAKDTIQFRAIRFSAHGTAIEDITDDVSWSCDNPDAGSISSSGEFTASSTLTSKQTATVTATTRADSGQTTITVIPLESINIIPDSAVLTVGEKQQFIAVGTFGNGSKRIITGKVIWACNNESAGSINSTGLFTAVSSIEEEEESANITATLGKISDTAAVTVKQQQVILQRIKITPAEVNLSPLGTQKFTATGHYNDGSTKDITNEVRWNCSNPGAGFITSRGLFIAAFMVVTTGPQQATISATLGDVTSAPEDSAEVTVNPPYLTEINIYPTSAILEGGDRLQFTAIGRYGTAEIISMMRDITDEVTWSCTHEDGPAGVINDDTRKGLFTANSVSETRVAHITASMDDGRDVVTSNKANVTVLPSQPVLNSIIISPVDPDNLYPCESQQFTATGHFSLGEEIVDRDITNEVRWNCDNPAAGFINNRGRFFAAPRITQQQVVNISASLDGIQSNEVTFNVNPPPLNSITIFPSTAFLYPQGTLQFTAIGYYADGSRKNITGEVNWASEAINTGESVGNIHPTTGLFTASITFDETQGAYITASLGLVTSNQATILPVRLKSITIQPPSMTLLPEGTLKFTATGNYNNSAHEDISADVTWRCSSDIGTIDEEGNFTAVAWTTTILQGTVAATDKDTGITGTAQVTINPASLDEIKITPADVSINPRGTVQYTAIGYYNNGAQRNITKEVHWACDNPDAGRISTTGLFTANESIYTTVIAHITASKNGKSDQATVTISPYTPPTTPPSVDRLSNSTGAPGDTVTIIGFNFGQQQGDNTVTFNQTLVEEFDSWSNYRIICTVPNGATTGPVVVTVNGQKSNDDVIFTIED